MPSSDYQKFIILEFTGTACIHPIIFSIISVFLSKCKNKHVHYIYILLTEKTNFVLDKDKKIKHYSKYHMVIFLAKYIS